MKCINVFIFFVFCCSTLADSQHDDPELAVGYILGNKTVWAIRNDLRECIRYQSNPPPVLVNNGLVVMNAADSKLYLSNKHKYDDANFKILLDDCQKKAILMAILRLNSFNVPDIYIDNFDKYRKEDILYAILYNDFKLTIPLAISRDSNLIYSCVLKDPTELFFEIPYAQEISSYGVYSKELKDLIRNILKDKILMKDSLDVFPKESIIDRFILKHCENDSKAALIQKFDYLKEMWDKSIRVSYSYVYIESGEMKSRTYEMELCGDKWQAMLVALMRLKINIGTYVTVYLRKDNLVIGDGGFNKLKMEFPDGKSYIFYIKVGVENIVGIRRVDADIDNNIESPVIPDEGGYASPELYNIIISLFADIAREEFLRNSIATH